MPTQFTKGDLLADPSLSAYAFGCTTRATIDTGIARTFASRWPRLAEEHKMRCDEGRFHLGDVMVFIDDKVTIYALALQEHWKSRSKLPALAAAMKKTVALASHAGVTRIGLPRIGAGLGGLEWLRVKSTLSAIGDTSPVELVVFEQFIRAKSE